MNLQTPWLKTISKALAFSAICAAATAQSLPANANVAGPPANAPRYSSVPMSAGASKRPAGHIHTNITSLNCGVQFSSWIAPNDTQYWFTYNWDPTAYVNWTLMDDTPWDNGSVSMTNIASDRNDPAHLTYHFVITNQSANWKLFEARYCFD